MGLTGPSEGKLELEGARVVVGRGAEPLQGAVVYIHVKGYALARVTHLDVEHEGLDGLIRGRGAFLSIQGIGGGISIELGGGGAVQVAHPLLERIMPAGSRTRTWVGSKASGVYVGFRREQVRLLERVAAEEFGVEPR